MNLPKIRIATGGCSNALCAVCSQRGRVAPRSVKDILADIESAADHGAKDIYFDDHEPLSHPEIKAIVAACVRYRLRFVLAASGRVPLTSRTLENLRKLGLKAIVFRLAGFHPEVGQLVWGDRRVGEHAENALRTILDSGLACEVECPVTPDNRGTLDRSLLDLERRFGLKGRLVDFDGHFIEDIARAEKRVAIRRGENTPVRTGCVRFYPVKSEEMFEPSQCPYRSWEDSEEHGPNSAWIRSPDGSWKRFETDDDASLHLTVAKNLRGRMLLHTSEGTLPVRLDDTCKSCPRLVRCGAAFVPDDSPHEIPDKSEEACPARFDALREALSKHPERLKVAGASTVCHAVEEGATVPDIVEEASLETWEVVDIARQYGYGVVDYDLDRNVFDGSWRLVLGEDSPALQRAPGALAVLQLSSACVNRCIMCSLPQMFHGQWVSSEHSVRLLEELYLLGYDTCDIFGGEITLRGDFVELLRFAKEIGLRATFISSGYNLDRERIDTLAEAGVDKCTLALDSLDPGLHDAIKNRTGIHEQAMRAIRAVLDNGRLPLEINTVVLTQNVYELPELHEALAKMGIRRHRLFYCIDGLFGMGDPPYLTYEQALDFIREVHPNLTRLSQENGTLIDWCPPVEFSRSIEEEAQRLSKGIYTDDSVSCMAPGKEIYVMVDGSVYPCVNPTIWRHEAVGKVGRDRLIDIERGSKMQEFCLKAGHLPACVNCISKRS